MEFDEIVVKESPGLCRCCLSEGCYKDLSTEYTWMDDTEVYADMLLECFDISISQHNEGPNGPNRLICEVCITRLRDACNFKKQVQASEKKFVDMIGRGAFKPKVLLYQSPIKTEQTAAASQQLEELDTEYLEEDADFGNDELLKEDESAEQVTLTEDITVATLPVKGKRGRPRKKAAVAKDTKSKVVKTENKPRTSKAIPKERINEANTEETVAMRYRRILEILFNNTSIIPFKWRGDYICFYCGLKTDHYEELYRHTKSHGPCSMETLDQRACGLNVKLDVTNLTCNLCKRSFHDFDSVVDHLIEKHKLEMDKDVNRILVYNLKDLKCVKCDGKFECIEDLISHVYVKHSQKEIVVKPFKRPEIATKSTKVKTRIATCDKTSLPKTKDDCTGKGKRLSRLSNRNDMRQIIMSNRRNIASIVKMSTAVPFKYYQNRFACFYCSEGFLEHEEMRQHTTTKHGVEEIDKCLPVILKKTSSRVFIDIAALSCRLCVHEFDDLESLIDHLIEKHEAKCDRSVIDNVQAFKLIKYGMTCRFCSNKYSYFNSLLKHINEEHASKSHLCSVCGASFGSEAVLSSHVSRIHGKDTFKCAECDSAFKSMLKLKCHRARKHGSMEFTCTKCNEMFLTHYGKQKHLLMKHGVGHKCMRCDKMFTKDSFMWNHVRRVHLEEREVECTICKKKFFNRERLRLHMVKHTGTREFQCDVCGKGFYWKKNLAVHKKSHNKRTK